MRTILIISALLLIFNILNSQELKRKASFGAQITGINDSIAKVLSLNLNQGVVVKSIDKKGTANNLHLEANDVIYRINQSEIKDVADLKSTVGNLREGDQVMVAFYRDGKPKTSISNAEAKPRESSDKFEVIYEAADFDGGKLSMIVTKPKGEGKFPAILFIPGYMCYSLDNIGNHPYGQIVNKLTEQGFVVVRVEKPGEGDCMNTPSCRSIGFNKEVDAFDAGFKKMATLDYVDTTNLFVFGHSLGAMEAPLISARNKNVKGVIIEGTSGDSWFEYILDMFRYQNPIMGVDVVENEEMISKATPMLYEYLVQKKSPTDLAKNPDYKTILMEMMQYDGGEQIWDRHYKYWQELQDFNQAEAWKNTSAKVLVMRGSGDLEAFSNEQHQLITRTINSYHPGNAIFVELKNSDHAFCKSNTPEESFKNGQTPGYHYNQFNDDVIKVVTEWINSQK